jgi:hypothetical protein
MGRSMCVDEPFNVDIGSIHDEYFGLLLLASQSVPRALEEQVSRTFKTMPSRSAQSLACIGHIHGEYAQPRGGTARCEFIRRQ